MKSWEELTHDRQSAIDVLLRMMGCTCLKQARCEHLLAITDLVTAAAQSTVYEVGGFLYPRRKQRITDKLIWQLMQIGTVTHIRPDAIGHREGKL